MPEGVREPQLSVATYEYAGDRDEAMGVATIDITGPFAAAGTGETSSRRRIFVCRPSREADEEPCATKILTTLARRAYRRPVVSDDVAGLMNFYRAGRRAGSFDSGIELAVRSILVDPDFLFRAERDPRTPREGRTLSGERSRAGVASFAVPVEHDSRRRAARSGGARSAVGCRGTGRQVERMLADRRATSLVDQLRRAMAASAQHEQRDARPRGVPGVRREPARGDAAGNGDVSRTPDPRGSGHRRAADRRLHVPERAARSSLRRRRRVGQPIPPRHDSTTRRGTGCSATAAS